MLPRTGQARRGDLPECRGNRRCERADAVFIDDRALNVEPALALGLHAVQFQGLDSLRDFLKERGIVV